MHFVEQNQLSFFLYYGINFYLKLWYSCPGPCAFVGDYSLTTFPISSVETDWSRFSSFPGVSFGELYLPEKLAISSKCKNYLHRVEQK